MKKINSLLFFCVLMATSFAQEIPRQAIEDSVLGWMKVYNFKGAKEPLKLDAKLYSAAQLSLCDSFVNWMQASYIPKGGLGDVRKFVSEKLGLYNQSTAAQPQSYGAGAKIYLNLKYNSSHKIVPFTNSHLKWWIAANALIGTPTDALNSASTTYYFTLPSFAEQGYGEPLDKMYNLAAHAVVKKYDTYYQRNSATGNERSILLFNNKRSPFIKVTKGEYVQATEAAIIRLYEKEKKEINENPGNTQKNKEYFVQYLDEKNAKRIACLKNNKEKYKDKLQEAAEMFTIQPDAMLENYPDIFEGKGGSSIKIPVYKVNPLIAEQCKTDRPQWIVISWTADLVDETGKYLYESIINNFDFDYVYNFFFEPEKIKGQKYKPLRSPSFKEALVVTEASEVSKKNTHDKNIHFFEDCSTTAIVIKTFGWQTSLGFGGTTGAVSQPAGLVGNWVE